MLKQQLGSLPTSILNKIEECTGDNNWLLQRNTRKKESLPCTTMAPIATPSAQSSDNWTSVSVQSSKIPIQLIDNLDNNEKRLNPSELFVLREKSSPGFIVKDSFLGSDLSAIVFSEIVQLYEEGKFQPAGMGRGEDYWKEASHRGDLITWYRKSDTPNINGISLLLDTIENTIIEDLKREAPEFNLINKTSVQIACYPGNGKQFVKHVDSFTKKNPFETFRQITCVYYLNQNWATQDGGHLRLHPTKKEVYDAAPICDRLIVFRSTDVEHQVLPTYKNRFAITVWVYSRVPLPGEQESELQTFTNRAIPLNVRMNEQKDDTIFVSIPSYRDSECQKTISNLFQTATHPNRIFVGVFVQHDPRKDVFHLPDTWKSQIRVLEVSWLTAKGPIYARAMVQTLYRGEKYYLQIDSHMRFRPHWDSFLIDQLQLCNSEKPILTTYPFGYELLDGIPDSILPTLLCAKGFDENGILRVCSKVIQEKQEKPIPSLFWAAGFSFSHATLLQEVPYDPHLKFLFFGEEMVMSMRLYTHGWDFFSPSEAVLFHLWSRTYRSTFQEVVGPQSSLLKQLSLKRVKFVLQGLPNDNDEKAPDTGKSIEFPDISKYSLGSQRSLEVYETYCGINLRKKYIFDKALWGNQDRSFFRKDPIKLVQQDSN